MGSLPFSTKNRIRRRARQSWNRDEVREARIAGMKKAWKDDEARARRIESLRAAWADPEVKARRSKAICEGKRRKARRLQNGRP